MPKNSDHAKVFVLLGSTSALVGAGQSAIRGGLVLWRSSFNYWLQPPWRAGGLTEERAREGEMMMNWHVWLCQFPLLLRRTPNRKILFRVAYLCGPENTHIPGPECCTLS